MPLLAYNTMRLHRVGLTLTLTTDTNSNSLTARFFRSFTFAFLGFAIGHLINLGLDRSKRRLVPA
jgi:hypothetical protein